MRKGWRNESARHSLAARGVKTGSRNPVWDAMKQALGAPITVTKKTAEPRVTSEAVRKSVGVAKKSWATVLTQVRLASGKVVDAKLWGVKRGDLWGGEVRMDGKWVNLDDLRRTPGVFPFKSTKKTTFVDLDVVKKRKK